MLFETLTRLDRLGLEPFSALGEAIAAPVDLRRDGERYVIEMDLPGIDPASVDVTVEDQALTIRAERSKESASTDAEWVVRERSTSTYVRRFTLGTDADPDGIQADYHRGVLSVVIPVVAGSHRHKIPVVAGSAEHRTLAASSTTPDAETTAGGKGSSRALEGVLRRLSWARLSEGSMAQRMRGWFHSGSSSSGVTQ